MPSMIEKRLVSVLVRCDEDRAVGEDAVDIHGEELDLGPRLRR
jgi:hypothetical protein